MPSMVETDIAILGGGVTGLWLLNRLRQLGFSAILLESAVLGGGQTHKSQGIIHGGMKFALQGSLNAASQTIADMPAVWKQCLQGKGDIDLTHVPILSQQQYLWSTGKLASKITGFFANVALQGRVSEVAPAEYPAVFQNPQFKGLVYALDEIAIDVHALIRELVKPHQDVIFKIDPLHEDQLQFDAAGRLISLEVQALPNKVTKIKAQKYIFVAGAGNELILKKWQQEKLTMQRRPLHMVVVKTDFDYPVFAHCFGMGATPRITITTHHAQDGKSVWYLGGQIAEDGVKRNADEQTALAKKELQELFPWLDFSAARFASFFIDRAEPTQPGGKRPDGAYMKHIENTIVAWPTKLALAPQLAEEIISALQHEHLQPGTFDARALRAFPMPALAKPIWDELLC
jgi:glycerol-3-phosphate dehydrogenase